MTEELEDCVLCSHVDEINKAAHTGTLPAKTGGETTAWGAGHWGSAPSGGLYTGTHCRYCHRSWRSKEQVHCRVVLADGSRCCAQFASDNVARKHFVGRGGHSAPSKLDNLEDVSDHFGTVWVSKLP
jgi:hypothetical protein